MLPGCKQLIPVMFGVSKHTDVCSFFVHRCHLCSCLVYNFATCVEMACDHGIMGEEGARQAVVDNLCHSSSNRVHVEIQAVPSINHDQNTVPC